MGAGGKRKKAFVVAWLAAVTVVGVASAAFACQVLATLSLSPSSGPAGTTVTATGSNYGSTTEVVLRLDTRDGPVLARGYALPGVGLRLNFTIPAGTSPGYHTILATQYTMSGAPQAGTPGRAVFEVTGAATGSSPPQTPVAASSAGPADLLAPWPFGAAAIVVLVASGRLTRRRRGASPHQS